MQLYLEGKILMYWLLSKVAWNYEQVAIMFVNYSPFVLLAAMVILCYGVCSLESRRKELWFEETLGSAGWRLQVRGRRLGQMPFPTYWASVDGQLMRIRPLATTQDVDFQAWFGYSRMISSGILAVRCQGAVFLAFFSASAGALCLYASCCLGPNQRFFNSVRSSLLIGRY